MTQYETKAIDGPIGGFVCCKACYDRQSLYKNTKHCKMCRCAWDREERKNDLCKECQERDAKRLRVLKKREQNHQKMDMEEDGNEPESRERKERAIGKFTARKKKQQEETKMSISDD